MITITADGMLLYEGVPLARENISSLFRLNPEIGINLFVDRAAPFESFLSVIDEARLLGRDDVSITTLPAARE